MKKVIIFGAGKIADVAYWTFVESETYSVEGFVCDEQFIEGEAKWGKNIIAFSDLEKNYPPGEYKVFVAIGYHALNSIRAEIVLRLETLGYEFANCISRAAYISNSAELGRNCLILDGASIQPCTTLGSNVFVWSNCVVGHHSIIEDHCWMASNAVIGGGTVIGKKSFLGLGSVVGHEVSIGSECFIGANANVLKNTKENCVLIEKSTEKIRLDSKRFMQIANL